MKTVKRELIAILHNMAVSLALAASSAFLIIAAYAIQRFIY